MNQASSVPMMAQRIITTTVRLTVFHSNSAVRLRNSKGSKVPHPTWTAWATRKPRGSTTATVATSAPSSNGRGTPRRRRRSRYRGGRVGTPGGTGGRSLAGAAMTEVTAPSQQLGLLQQLDGQGTGPQLGDGDRVRLELVERRLARPLHPRGDRVLPALAVVDDLLPGLRGQVGQELLRLGLVRRGLEDARAGDVDHVAHVVGREVGQRRVHVRGAHQGALSIPVVLVDDPDGRLAPVDLVDQGLVVGVGVATGVRLVGLEPLE